jgi:DinB superfamily
VLGHQLEIRRKVVTHPLVLQLRFTRSEFQRALVGLTDDEARQRFMPMNCISWNIGHLAWQEQRYWLWRGQGKVLLPEINKLFAYGAPASTPSLTDMWEAWHKITQAADPWLETFTTEKLQEAILIKGKPGGITFGSLLRRTTYHYWYHTGENMAIRQVLGHTKLPDFVGDIDGEAPYVPELQEPQKKKSSD